MRSPTASRVLSAAQADIDHLDPLRREWAVFMLAHNPTRTRVFPSEEPMPTTRETREEFIAGYCNRSNMTWEFLSGPVGRMVALPCACGDDECRGWAMVRNDQDSIDAHMELYAPEGASQ